MKLLQNPLKSSESPARRQAAQGFGDTHITLLTPLRPRPGPDRQPIEISHLKPREAVGAPFITTNAVMHEEQSIRVIFFFDAGQTLKI